MLFFSHFLSLSIRQKWWWKLALSLKTWWMIRWWKKKPRDWLRLGWDFFFYSRQRRRGRLATHICSCRDHKKIAFFFFSALCCQVKAFFFFLFFRVRIRPTPGFFPVKWRNNNLASQNFFLFVPRSNPICFSFRSCRTETHFIIRG